MADRHLARPWRAVAVVALVGIVSALAPTAGLLRADELERRDASLQWVPQDVAFYSSALRNRQQIEAIARSRAWAQLKQMPIVQMGLQLLRAQAAAPGGPVAQIEASLESPDVRQLLALLGDMFSDEVFICGDRRCVSLVDLLQKIVAAIRYGPVVMQLGGQAEDVDPDQLHLMLALTALCENTELLEIPQTLFGFRLRDTDGAVAQLAKLETIARIVCDGNPLLEGRFKRTKLGKYEYLSLSLDGKMIPWDELPLEDLENIEANPGDIDKLVARIKKMTLVIALGLRDDYLLLSIGPSTNLLARLGEGKPLVELPELKPLGPFAQRPLTSVGYLSKELSAKIRRGHVDIDRLLLALDELLSLAELDGAQESRIRKDSAELAKDLRRLMPPPGAMTTFSFLSDRGIESYQYDWAGHPSYDGSKPLGLLEHVGGNPLLAAVWRQKHRPQDYDILVKWLKVAYRYFQQYAVPEMSPGDREDYEQFVKLVGPLVPRLDKATRTMLIPALADSQGALVLDARLQSRRFVQALPATDKPMPMLEPAFVLGVSDTQLLLAGLAECRQIINGVIDVLREVVPDEIPDWAGIPEAEVRESSAGTVYCYPLPVEWGVDERIAPNLGICEEALVLSVSPEQTRRMLAPSALKIGGLLAQGKRPLAAAVGLDWAAAVDAATPWVDLAVKLVLSEQLGDLDSDEAKGQAAAIGDQVHTVLDVLKTVRSLTSESYFERDALVRHTLLEIRDLQ